MHGTGNDRYYDIDKLIAGSTIMGSDEARALALATNGVGVKGLDVLHLQCHIGCDTISMTRDEARVTGADFSKTALAWGQKKVISERRPFRYHCGLL